MSLLLKALSIILTWTLGVNSVLSIIASKLYLASILGWLFILTMYVYAITFKKAERFSLTKTSSLLKILMGIIPVGIVFLVAIFILPIKIIDNGNIIYYSDYSPYLIYAINMMCVIGWLIRYIIRYHYIKV